MPVEVMWGNEFSLHVVRLRFELLHADKVSILCAQPIKKAFR